MPVAKNVTEPFEGIFQVRIVRKGREYSSTFNTRNYHSREAALAAAEHWRDQLLETLPKHAKGLGTYLTEPLSHKKSWGRVAISRYVHRDNRRNGAEYVRFGVNWVDDEQHQRVTQFEAGRVGVITWEQELHASLTAEAFRSEWEYCRDHGLPFDPTKYTGWKKAVCYPFIAPTEAPPSKITDFG